MSKGKKDLHIQTSAQESLFDPLVVEGALDLSLAFRDSLSRALGKAKDSRYQVAAKVSELTRRQVSKEMLDKYCSSNLDYGLRAENLPAVLFVLGNLEPARILLQPLGCDVVAPEESKYVRLARLEQENQKLQAEMARLKHELGIGK